MVVTLILALGHIGIPPVPPGRTPLPQYKGVEFRLREKDGRLKGELVNRTSKTIAWTTGGYMVACFTRPLTGGPIVLDPIWSSWKRPTEWFKTETFSLPAKGRIAWGWTDIPKRLRLRPGRYEVWEIYYPAFETERWITSNSLFVSVP